MQEETKKPKTEEVTPVQQPVPQAPVAYEPYAPVEPAGEGEINLLDLFIVLLKHKFMIFSAVILTGMIAVAYSLTLPNVYRSECTIAPTSQEKGPGAGLAALGGLGAMIASDAGLMGAGSLEMFDVVLKSRELTNIVVRQYNLLPLIFDEAWDTVNKRWKVGKPSTLPGLSQVIKGLLVSIMPAGNLPEKNANELKFPTPEDTYNAIQGMLNSTTDKKRNIMVLSIEHKDPRIAQKLLDFYIVGMSEFLRQQTLTEATAQQQQLSLQLAKTTDPLLKNRLYELIARQIEKETLTRVQKYYSFNIIDSAFVPEHRFKPKRSQICILSVVVGFFVAVFLAFFLEYVHNLKTHEDPERLANLRNALRLWGRRK